MKNSTLTVFVKCMSYCLLAGLVTISILLGALRAIGIVTTKPPAEIKPQNLPYTQEYDAKR